MKWFRVYSEIKDDPKMLELDDHQRWLWICLLAMASEAEERGVIANVRLLGLAAALRTDEKRLSVTLDALADMDMLTYDAEQRTIRICHWTDRQYDKPSDTPPQTRDRQRASRQRHANVTPSHALDTDTDTDTDTDRDTDTRSRAAAAPQSSLPPQVQVFIDNGGKFPTGKLTDGMTRKAAAIAYICERVRDTPAALALWGRVVAGYCKQWSPKSYTVMVQEYYLNNRIPGEQRNGNGAGGREHPGITALRMVQEEERGNQ